MIKKCHYDVILWGGFGSTKCDPNLTSHLHRFFAGTAVTTSIDGTMPAHRAGGNTPDFRLPRYPAVSHGDEVPSDLTLVVTVDEC